MSKIKNIASLIILCIFFANTSVFAQLELPYTSSLFYGTLTNPAFAEKDSAVQFVFLNRDQWNGTVGAPKSQVLSASVPLSSTSNLGTNIFRNTAGVSERFTFDLFYNYKITLENASLRFGILASMQQERRDFTKDQILLTDPLASDELIAEGIVSFSSFNSGIGMHYESGYFNFGLSFPRLLANRLGLFGSENVSNNTPIFVYVNGNIPVSRGITMRNRANLQFDSNQYSLFQYFAGINYRNQLDAGVQLNSQITNGFRLQSFDVLFALAIHKNFSLGFSYSIPLSPITEVTPGSFEVFISYLIPSVK